MFKTVPILIFSMIPLLLVLLFVTVASMDGVDSERETFPASPSGRLDINQIELAYVQPVLLQSFQEAA